MRANFRSHETQKVKGVTVTPKSQNCQAKILHKKDTHVYNNCYEFRSRAINNYATIANKDFVSQCLWGAPSRQNQGPARDLFPLCHPPPPPPPVTEHVPLHSKLLCKQIARVSGGCKYILPLSPGGTNEKIREKRI